MQRRSEATTEGDSSETDLWCDSEDGPSATTSLGMDGLVLVAAGVIDGELHQVVETTASVVGCSACGTRAWAVSKGRREVKVRDMASADRPVVVVWRKRLWRCDDPDCDTKTWSEQVDAIAPRASLTRRARADICAQVGSGGRSVAAVATHYDRSRPNRPHRSAGIIF